MARVTNQPESKYVIPKVTPEEIAGAVNELAARAKRRFLEGAAAEAAQLAGHARRLVQDVDEDAEAALAKLESMFASFAPKAPPAAPESK